MARKISQRRQLLLALGGAGLKDFRTKEEMNLAQDLVKLMEKNDSFMSSQTPIFNDDTKVNVIGDHGNSGNPPSKYPSSLTGK